MGNVAKELGEYIQARELYLKSLDIKREIGDRKGIANSLGNLGNIALALGQHDEATKYHQEALILCEEIGFGWGMVSALVGLGNDSRELGETQKSREYLYEALDIATDISAVPLLLDVVVGIASLSTTDKEKALELLTFVLRHPGAYTHTRNAAEQLRSELRTQLEPQVVSSAEKRGKSRDLGKVVEMILREKE
jgi:tetratricopeptide (TPR) repeat protein